MLSQLGSVVLRVSAGGMMLFDHGLGKLARLMDSGLDAKFADPLGFGPFITLAFAAFAEGICAGAVLVGYKTRWATVPLVITMAVAALVVHGDDPFKRKEMALLYCTVFLAVMALGAGRYSLDAYLSSRRK